MARHPIDRIQPLWMERLEEIGFQEDLRPTGLDRLSWPALMREAEALRQQIAAGTLPPSVEALKQLRHPSLIKASPERLKHFDPESLLGFLCLPSVLQGMIKLESLMMRFGAPISMISNTLETVTHELYHLTRFKYYGKKIYVLDQTTYDLLLKTELPDMPLGLLRPPMPEFYLVLPEGHDLKTEVNGDIQPVEGAMVSFPSLDAIDAEISTRELSILVTGRSEKHAADDNLNFLTTVATSDIPINQLVSHSFGAQTLDLQRLLHVIFGTMLYLASEHPSLEPVPPLPTNLDAIRSPKKRAKAERKLQRFTRFGYIRLRTDFESQQEQQRPQAPSQRGTGRRLDHAVWVTGHWRYQPYGKGRKLRKWIWIKPHQRGPDMAEAMQMRLHKIQTAQEARNRVLH